MMIRILRWLRGPGRIYDHNLPGAYSLESISLHGIALDYWYVGIQHALSRKTMPLYFNFTGIVSIVWCRSFLGHYVQYGIAGALSADFREASPPNRYSYATKRAMPFIIVSPMHYTTVRSQH